MDLDGGRLSGLRSALDRLDLSLAGPEADGRRAKAGRLIGEYLIPRLGNPEDSMVVAFVGVSGAGKSTIVNSIARRRVTGVGTLRPTTIEPVAWGPGGLPATLDAVRQRLPGRMVEGLRRPPEGVVLVDTPPPGVLGAGGAPVASQIIDVADACVLVAGADRYADSAGFDLASQAADRGLPTVFVLNRLPAEPRLQADLIADFAAKLYSRGLVERGDPEYVVAVVDGPVSAERGGLVSDSVTGVAKELERLAEPSVRSAIVEDVVRRTAVLVGEILRDLRGAYIRHETRRSVLADPVALAYGRESRKLLATIREGGYAGLSEDPAWALGLATATARRAGRAALASAEAWVERKIDPPSGLWAHGPETLAEAEERMLWWASELPRLAGDLGLPRKGRKAARLAAAVRQSILDPDHSPRRSIRKVLSRSPELLEVAAQRLGEEITAIMEADSSRFFEELGGASAGLGLAGLDLEPA